jgi:hypothetical protein
MSIEKANFTLLSKGFLELLQEARYKDNWWCDVVLVEVMKTSYHYGMLLDSDSVIAAKNLNCAITRNPAMSSIDNHYRTNENGIYRMNFRFKDENNKPMRRNFYHACSNKTKLPPALTIKMAQEVYQKKLRTSPRSAKRSRGNNDDDDANETLPEMGSGSIESPVRQSTNPPPLFDYWSSTEAINLFRPRENEHVMVALDRMIDVCEFKASENKGSSIAYKYLLLKKAYDLALANMNAKNWKQCCAESIAILKEAGIDIVKCPRTIMIWNRFFRFHECLEADIKFHNKKVFEPRFFALYPEVKSLINKHFLRPTSKQLMLIVFEFYCWM